MQPISGDPLDGPQLVAGLTHLGIRQQGDPILHQVAQPFTLPDEAEEARELEANLVERVQRVKQLHTFSKGIGLAAPQIGISRALAIVQVDGQQLTLINPVVVTEAEEQDTQYEGCLSFFDVRGEVPRPLRVRVAVTDLDGTRRELSLQQGMARLVLHEVDHLYGRLYTVRMLPGTQLIPLAEYRQSGTAWHY
jgi:peptide deformylase